MTNLSRVTGKVFGGSAPLDEIGQFGSAAAGTKLNTQDVATIQALPAYSSGWGSAIMTSRNFPPIEEVTGVLKTISYQNCYLLQEGVPTYDIGTNYSATSIVKVIDNTNLSFYVSLTDDNIGNPLSDGTHWAKASFADRNIGEIVTSTIPLSDGGLHLLDGSLLSGDGIYKQFVDYIANIYNSSLNFFCTEAEWQETVTNYGVCGKFVYDSVNGTVRLPKITGFTEGAVNTTSLGDLTEAGLPNITGSFLAGAWANGINGTGAFQDSETHYQGGLAGGQGAFYANTGILNASYSSSIYGNSSTVQPQAINVLYYIVVGTQVKTDIEVDIDEIATDLNGKVDLDGTNATFPHITESYSNDSSWYNVYSNGWCEQGGRTTGGSTVNLLKPYIDTNFSVLASHLGSAAYACGYSNNSTSQIFIYCSSSGGAVQWQTAGYIR